jgi:hypothetical protein
MDMSGGPVFIGSIAGTGPYTLTLRNKGNTFKGFDSAGPIVFNASTGDASTWFASDTFTNPLTATWSIGKVTNGPGKKLGTTFWNFYCAPQTAVHQPVGGVSTILYIRAMTGYNPSTNVGQGVSIYDYYSSNIPNQAVIYSVALTISSTSTIPLTLRVRQSSVDPNFAVFTFLEGNNPRNNFILSKYDNSIQPWSLNDVFLGGVYELFANPTYANAVNDAAINFRTRMTCLPKRMAEAGYGSYYQAVAATVAYTNTFYRTASGSRQLVTPTLVYGDINFYSRNVGDIQTSVTNMPIYKNIPICPAFSPVPYYLPSDFILAEMPFANPNIGDTLTVSGSEIYTVIQYAMNPTTYTGLVLAARTT